MQEPYILERAKKHKVTHLFSGKHHHFRIDSDSGEEYNIGIRMSCDCRFMAIQGQPNGNICSHILATLNTLVIKGQVANKEGVDRLHFNDNPVFCRRNECLNLVRVGNRIKNVIRYSSNEGKLHKEKKEELCEKLEKAGKEYVTEAIFENGEIADILVLDDLKVIEIAHTETDESLIEKSKKYPPGLSIEVVRV